MSNYTYLYNHNTQKAANFNVWMAFPGPEDFALSSLGYLWMYKTLDETDKINVEAVFEDTEFTTINKDNLNMIGFSCSFDMDIFKIFKMLDKYNIPFLSSDRDERYPFIFAGGPVVTANPEPYKNFFDFFIIGDGEELNQKAVLICEENSDKPKTEVLRLLAQTDGIYVPRITTSTVKKVTNKLSECIYTPVISEKAFFKNTFIMEVERGCANMCGFCLASYLNLPVRFVDYDKLLSTLNFGLNYTNKIALLGAQITAHPHFKDICKYIYDRVQSGEQITLSISSMRVDAFSPEIVKALVATGQKNTTLAIEAGSERLRKFINKHLSEEQIFNAVKIACDNGLKGLKFYGMIGLPTETQRDIDEMISLAKRIKKEFKGFDISFGFSSFVPKPNTPFQWFGRENTKTLEKKCEYLRKELHKIGINAQMPSIKWDYYQAVLSRGDESLTQYLIDVYKKGQTLGSFKSCAKGNIDTDYYALTNYEYDAKLPWDIIDITPGKSRLIAESKRLFDNYSSFVTT